MTVRPVIAAAGAAERLLVWAVPATSSDDDPSRYQRHVGILGGAAAVEIRIIRICTDFPDISRHVEESVTVGLQASNGQGAIVVREPEDGAELG